MRIDRFCIDCVHHAEHGGLFPVHECMHQDNLKLDPVDGKLVVIQSCTFLRASFQVIHCGPHGQKWEEKDDCVDWSEV